MIVRYLKLFILLFYATSVTAQVSFEAIVAKQKLGINERLRIEFKMNKDGDNFKPPMFKNFRVIAGPQQSVTDMFNNGKRSYSKSYIYFLSPLKQGNLQIEQAEIEIDGRIYKSNPVPITVTSAVEKPLNPNDPSYIAKEKMHLVAELSRSNPYLNEPVTIRYKLYYARSLMLTNLNILDSPKFKDFWSYKIENKRLQIRQETYKGERYNYVEVWAKTILYPQRSGKLEIEPLSIDVSIDVPTGRRDFFGNQTYTQVARVISAGKRTLQVKALPEEGKPADFSGAVGSFTFEVNTTKKELNASESLQAVVKVSGTGNLNLFELPELETPSSLERYEPEFKERVNSSPNGMKGFISNSYTLVPQFQGKYPISAINFSYFDPNLKQYKTLQSKEQIINVLEGPTIGAVPQPSNNTITALPQGTPFQFIKLKTQLKPIKQQLYFRSMLFYMIWGIPLGLFPVVMFIIYRNRRNFPDLSQRRSKNANRLARKYLGTAKKNLKNPHQFYIALERALHNYLKAKLKIETTDFSKEKIENVLTQIGVDTSNVSQFIALLERCELARYTPNSEGDLRADYQQSIRVIAQLDKQF